MPREAPRLPHCIIGGAPRSGTTLLCHLLDQHPNIYVAKPFIPEPKVCMTPAEDGIEGYRRRYAELFQDAPEDAVLVEKTSYYLENEEALHRLRQVLTDVRFVFIVREPVARAYSNYVWSRKNGLEPMTFAEAVANEGKRPSPLPLEKSYARPFDYLARADYATFAERYFEAFGRERVRFFLYEDIINRPEALLAELQSFVGVRPLPFEDFPLTRINSTEGLAEDLDAALEQQLRRQMRPLVERFAALADLDLSAWQY